MDPKRRLERDWLSSSDNSKEVACAKIGSELSFILATDAKVQTRSELQ